MTGHGEGCTCGPCNPIGRLVKDPNIARDVVALEMAAELRRARTAHGPMRSTHEGYAVLLEEVDELWEEVRKKHPDKAAMRKEAIQIGAMALAFALEVAS